MKFLLAIAAFLLTINAEVTFYNPQKNVTCSGHENGDITCEPGQAPEAKVISLEEAVTPAIRGRQADPLEKRVSCGLSDETCFVHCFAIGYCNSHCDDKGICRCYCYDKSPWPLVCTKTTCS